LERQARAIEAGRYGPFPHPSYEHYIAQGPDEDQRANPNSPYLQGAFIAMDPRTGAIRTLVGGRDFDDSKFNRAVQALRQPGSTFKPIVYADAVQNGRPPSYILDDSPLSYTPQGGQTWEPQNYDNKFEGKMPLRRALYESRNLATIRLGMELGEASVIDEARKFGITSTIPPYPSIHIGAASVYPIEMVAAYSAFATLGTRSAPTAIVRVENQKGDVLWAPTPQRTAVLSPEEAWLMVDMMKDVVRRGTAASAVWGSNSSKRASKRKAIYTTLLLP
jgi:penicillin-binding protein 1A